MAVANTHPPKNNPPITPTDPPGPWVTQAACHGKWSLMESEDPTVMAWARKVCRGCPVLTDCWTWVLGLPERADVDGIAATLDRRQRQAIRRRRVRKEAAA